MVVLTVICSICGLIQNPRGMRSCHSRRLRLSVEDVNISVKNVCFIRNRPLPVIKLVYVPVMEWGKTAIANRVGLLGWLATLVPSDCNGSKDRGRKNYRIRKKHSTSEVFGFKFPLEFKFRIQNQSFYFGFDPLAWKRQIKSIRHRNAPDFSQNRNNFL